MSYEQYEAKKSALWSELMYQVMTGQMTDIEAMEWFNAKCDEWMRG